MKHGPAFGTVQNTVASLDRGAGAKWAMAGSGFTHGLLFWWRLARSLE